MFQAVKNYFGYGPQATANAQTQPAENQPLAPRTLQGRPVRLQSANTPDAQRATSVALPRMTPSPVRLQTDVLGREEFDDGFDSDDSDFTPASSAASSRASSPFIAQPVPMRGAALPPAQTLIPGDDSDGSQTPVRLGTPPPAYRQPTPLPAGYTPPPATSYHPPSSQGLPPAPGLPPPSPLPGGRTITPQTPGATSTATQANKAAQQALNPNGIKSATVTLTRADNLKPVKATDFELETPFGKKEIKYSASFNGKSAPLPKKTLDELAGQTRMILKTISDYTALQYKHVSSTKVDKKSSGKVFQKCRVLSNMTNFNIRVVKGKVHVEFHSDGEHYTEVLDENYVIPGDQNHRSFTIGDHIRELKAQVQHVLETNTTFSKESGHEYLVSHARSKKKQIPSIQQRQQTAAFQQMAKQAMMQNPAGYTPGV